MYHLRLHLRMFLLWRKMSPTRRRCLCANDWRTSQGRALRLVPQDDGSNRNGTGEFRRHRSVARKRQRFHIDASARMYDGTALNGPLSLRQALVNHCESFIGSFTENLLAYGLGRQIGYRDMPVVRSIAREAARNNNRFSSFILGIVKSTPFQMRKADVSYTNDK